MAILPPYSKSLIEEGEEKGEHEKKGWKYQVHG
jgi:hypothetical protein